MDEFHLLAGRTVRVTLWTTLIATALWVLIPNPGKPLLAGLAIGSAVSWYYALSITRQIDVVTKFALGTSTRKSGGITWFARMAVVMLGGFAVSKMHASIWTFMVGMFVYQIVLYVTLFLGRQGK